MSLTEASTVNLKLLQLKLDGAVLASVNEGPGAIARAFFGQLERKGREF